MKNNDGNVNTNITKNVYDHVMKNGYETSKTNGEARAYYHLPGLFEFYEFYSVFLPLFREHREYFYDWCEIGSIYGAPADCLWGGGRVGYGDCDANAVMKLMREHGISARLTFSNSLLRPEHLGDKKCNELCRLFEVADNSNLVSDAENDGVEYCTTGNGVEYCTMSNGIIIASDILLDYIKAHYPEYYFISSTTKVITDFDEFVHELDREDFSYVVPDFRLNKEFDKLRSLSNLQKSKVEFLCNECCYVGCTERKRCYENVSLKSLGETEADHICKSPNADKGYRFSEAMKNPAFIGVRDIVDTYIPMGFTNFKIEGRSLGSAMLLEFILYYMVKPEYQLNVREEIYLDSMLDLF